MKHTEEIGQSHLLPNKNLLTGYNNFRHDFRTSDSLEFTPEPSYNEHTVGRRQNIHDKTKNDENPTHHLKWQLKSTQTRNDLAIAETTLAAHSISQIRFRKKNVP